MKLYNILHFINTLSFINSLNYFDFLNVYNKNYTDAGYERFNESLELVKDINERNLSYTLEMNYFADEPRTINSFTKKEVYEPVNLDVDMIIPEKIDWRDKDAVTIVKNQGRCGGCWAFSATGSVEGIVAIKTGTLYNISEQQLIDCSQRQGNNGCEGGLMDNAFNFIIQNDGLCSEDDYPFVGYDERCKQCQNVVSIKSFGDITQNDEKALKRAVAQQPVSVAIQANLTSFQLYKSGIYSDPECGDGLDHGVLVVGYGYDFFHNMDYWIVKNSWGPTWGENGYIRILRNSDNDYGMCGIASQPSIPIV